VKVLVVSHLLPPRHAAGVELYSVRLAKALRERGVDARLFAADDDPTLAPGSTRERAIEGVRAVEVAEARRVDAPDESWDNPRAVAALSRMLREFRPDVVHFQNARFLGFGAVEEAKRFGATVVFTLNDPWLICARDGLLLDRDERRCDGPEASKCAACLVGYRFGLSSSEGLVRKAAARVPFLRRPRVAALLRRAAAALRRRDGGADAADLSGVVARRGDALKRLVRATDLFVAPSRFQAEIHRRAGIPSSKIEAAGYGIDVEAPSRAPSEPGAPLRVAFFGVVSPHKAPHLVIEAASLLQGEGIVVDVYGRDDLRPEYAASLRRRARGLPVRFHGAYERSATASLMSRQDVVVVPSRWPENAPFVVLEARAAGAVVVAAKTGGLPESVRDGVDGDLFEPDDAASLAAVLRNLRDDRSALLRRREAAPAPRSTGAHVDDLFRLYARASATEGGAS
jgi:glycosyltransferase involved in cell wall biosynthesis